VQSKPVELECGSIVDAEEAIPGREISRRAGAIARALWDAKLRPGDRVALATADDAAFFVAFAACLATGLTAVVIDPRAAPGEVARMLTRAAPRALVADGAVARAVDGSSGVSSLAATILVGADDAGGGVLARWRTWRTANPRADSMRFDAVARGGDTGLEWREIDDAVPAYVMFTSGTTSTPKGVVISRRALFRHVRTLADVFGYGPDATLLHYLPLHHTDGLVHGPCAALLTGMHVVRPGPFSPLAAERLPDLLRDHRVTHFLAVPTILSFVQRIFATHPDLFRTGWFRHAISTAGYLDPQFWLEFETTFGLRLANFYGMTETVSGSVYCGPADTSYRRGTLGTPVDCRLRIVGEDGARSASTRIPMGRSFILGVPVNTLF
jgi:long-chain acyl-CoA synthetase